MTPDSVHDSSTGKSAELLRQPRDGEAAWSDEELAEVFRHQLAALVEFEIDRRVAPRQTAEKSFAGRDVSPETSGLRPLTFAALLHRRKPPLTLLRRAKEYAKAACKEPHGPLPPEVATALYFGVIASALVHRGERLTTLADQKLFRGLRWMIGQTWLDDATRDLAQRGLDQVARGLVTSPKPGGPSDAAKD